MLFCGEKSYPFTIIDSFQIINCKSLFLVKKHSKLSSMDILISGPCLGAKARYMSFNRTQSRAVTGLLTGHNTLRRHLHLPGLLGSPLYRRCGVEEETSAHILCECEAVASLRHAYLGSSSL